MAGPDLGLNGEAALPDAPLVPENKRPRRFLLRLSSGERNAVVLLAGFKVALLLLGAISYIVFQNKYPEGRGLWSWLSVWHQWDANAYQDIAERGYLGTEPSRLAFFPLFPLLVAVCRPLIFHDTLSATFFVSTVASLAVVLLLYKLARLDMNARRSERVVFAFLAFPTAYFLHIGFTESVFLAMTLGAVLAVRQRQWGIAGILGCLSATARMNGILLIPLFAVEALVEWRERRRLNADWLAMLGPLLGTGLYLYVNYRATGDPLAFLHFQKEHWNHHLAAPWTGLMNSFYFTKGASPTDSLMVGTAEGVSSLLVLVVGIYSLFRQRVSYGVWTLTNWILWSSNDFVMSVPRYVLVIFPFFLLLGKARLNRALFLAITTTFLLLQGLFATIFVQGRWAF